MTDQLSMKVLLAVAEIIVLSVFITVLIKATIKIVPQKKCLIIYRLGRFHRLTGSGLVIMMPFLEQVVRTLEIHERPLVITIEGVFAYGVPNDLTFNLVCSFDLVRAAAGDQESLANLVQLSESDRSQLISVKMREALDHQVSKLHKRMPLPTEATVIDGVVALAPGSERYNALLDGLKRELKESLPTIGVILSNTHSIVITGRLIPNDILKAIIERQRQAIESQRLILYAADLRKQFPDLPDTVLAKILSSSSIEDIDIGEVKKILHETFSKEEKTSNSIVADQMSQDIERKITQTRILSLQQELLERYRHLGQLQLQEARQGVHTPPHIIREIEDYKNNIFDLETQLLELNPKMSALSHSLTV